MPRWAPFAAMAPFIPNARGWVPGLAWLSEKLLGFAAGRSLPRFVGDAFHDAELPAPDGRGRRGHPLPRPLQPLFRAGEPPRRRPGAARRRLPRRWWPARRSGARPLDSGRTYLAAGLVDEARAEARRTLAALAAFDLPVIGIEPSCLLTLRDEFLSLLPGAAAEALAGAGGADRRVPGAGEAGAGAEAGGDGRAYPWPLPPEGLLRLPGGGGGAGAASPA